MAGVDNLIPFNKQTEEEQREKARKGGIASGEARRRKKTMKEQLDLLLSLPLKNPKARKLIENLGVNPDEIDNQMAISIAIMDKALKGSETAFNTIRDTLGEKPNEKIEHSGEVTVNYEELIKEIEDK